MLKSEMDNALHDGSGAEYGYDSSSAYYGAHIGIGQVIQLSDDSSVDVYGSSSILIRKEMILVSAMINLSLTVLTVTACVLAQGLQPTRKISSALIMV